MEPHDVISPDDLSESQIDEWDGLVLTTGGSYFQTATWSLAWWEHLAGRPESRVATWRAPDGSLGALAAASRIEQPLLRGSGPAVPVWVNMGSGAGAGDHLGWPATGDLRQSVIDWSSRSLPGPILLSNIAPATSAGLATSGFDLVDVSPTLAADLGEGDAWFPGSNDFRKKLRYYGRQLAKLDIDLEMLTAPLITPDLFDRLLELHAARSDHMGWGTHFDEERTAFHRALIGGGTTTSGPMMCVARRHGEVVGILYGFRFGDRFSYFQTGWSSEFVKQSLGSVLVAHTMEWASQNGMKTFDFLRGDDTYKRRFGATPRGDETWMLPRGATGRALMARRTLARLLQREET